MVRYGATHGVMRVWLPLGGLRSARVAARRIGPFVRRRWLRGQAADLINETADPVDQCGTAETATADLHQQAGQVGREHEPAEVLQLKEVRGLEPDRVQFPLDVVPEPLRVLAFVRAIKGLC